MRQPTTLELVFVVVGASVCAALMALSLPLWRQYHAHAVSVSVAVRPPPPRTPTVVQASRAAPRRLVAGAVTLRLQAARGSCWIVIRSASSTGAVRYVGTLVQGTSLQARGKQLWVSLGAAGNLNATLNGKRLQRFPTGTIDVIVTDAGVKPAALVRPAPSGGSGRA
jgi:hypothetical protein